MTSSKLHLLHARLSDRVDLVQQHLLRFQVLLVQPITLLFQPGHEFIADEKTKNVTNKQRFIMCRKRGCAGTIWDGISYRL